MLLVIDIDGTIADIRPRLANAGDCPDRQDRKQFQNWLDRLQSNETLAKDEPIKQMHKLIRELSTKVPEHFELIYLTGRSDEYREVTQRWLLANRFPEGQLIMRKRSNWASAADYKEAVLKQFSDKHYGENIIIFDDDYDGDCSPRYQANGWLHLKVCFGGV